MITVVALFTPLSRPELYLLHTQYNTLLKQLSQKTSYTTFGCAFGPNRNSSQHVATYTGSILHYVIISIWSRLDQVTSGYIPQTINNKLFMHAQNCLYSPKIYTCWPIIQKVYHHTLTTQRNKHTMTADKYNISVLFTPIQWVFFTIPSLY